MFKRNIFYRNYHILFLSLCFLFPLYKKSTVLIIALILLNSILEGRYVKRFQRYFQVRSFFILSALYLLHIVGMFNTTFVDVGLFDLEVKLGLIAFPLVFNMMNMQGMVKRYFRQYFSFFIYGLALSELICLAHSVILMKTGNSFTDSFFYVNFSFLYHPSYMASYLLTGMAVLVHLLLFERKVMSMKRKITIIFLVIYFYLGVMFANSKMGIITLVALVAIALYYAVFIQKLYRLGLCLVMGVVLITGIALVVYPEVFQRFKWMLDSVSSPAEGNKKNWDGSVERIYAWKFSGELIEENWSMGVGTGDIQLHLMKKYIDNGMSTAYNSRLNCHNQYLQTFVGLGVWGFVSLLMLFFYPLFLAIRNKDFFYICFLITFIMGCLVESMLESQAGVAFFSFMNSFYFSIFYVRKN